MALNQGKYRRAKGSEQKMSIYYCKDMFKVEDMEAAKKIILTEERQGGLQPDGSEKQFICWSCFKKDWETLMVK